VYLVGLFTDNLQLLGASIPTVTKHVGWTTFRQVGVIQSLCLRHYPDASVRAV